MPRDRDERRKRLRRHYLSAGEAEGAFPPGVRRRREPVIGTYRNMVVWQLPTVPRIEPHSAQFAFVVGTDGYISDCRVVSMTGKVPAALLANNPCSAPVRYEPYRDADGNPVARQVTLTFGAGVDHAPGDGER